MQTLAPKIADMLAGSSMIRRMFEAGIELKKKYGNDNVYDYSLGNPDLPPPAAVGDVLRDVADRINSSFILGYMSNAGYMDARAAVAKYLTNDQKADVAKENVVLSCGAAGAVNALFRAILTQGDEVVCPSPYFVEYGFYAGNFGASLVPVSTKEDFTLDLEAMDKAINANTRAVIINTPNNPTGRIYSKEELDALGDILRRHSRKNDRLIYLVSDEPYRFLNFKGVTLPSVFNSYEGSVIVGSFSKSLSMAGERAGYTAVCSAMPDGDKLVAALGLTTRILGFINAPVLAQYILEKCASTTVDMFVYKSRRDLLAQVLTDAGIEFIMPEGTFYFFPKSPVEDETVFVNALLNERVLAVPGRGFGKKGYFRLAFCGTDEKIIKSSAESFKRAVEAVKS